MTRRQRQRIARAAAVVALGDIRALPDRVWSSPQQSGAAMSNEAKRQYTAEIVQFDHAGKTIDEMPISATTDEEAIDIARKFGRAVCAQHGIGKARLIVLRQGEIKPILNEQVF
jgi:hypothetical protein